MESAYKKIIKFLKEKNVPFKDKIKEPSYTSSHVAAIRGALQGISPKRCVKTILLRGKGDFILIVLREDQEFDLAKLRNLLGVSDIRFASSEEINEVMNCSEETLYPFGCLSGLPTYVDDDLFRNKIIYFTPGIHSHCIKMKWDDYRKAVKPRMVDVSRDY